MTDNGAMKIFGESNRFTPNRVVLHVIPNLLFMVQFRRIRRQEEKSKTIFYRFDKPHRRLRFVRRRTVYNQEDHALSILEKPFDKFNKTRRTHSALDDYEPKLG